MTSLFRSLPIIRREVWGTGLSPDWPASPNWRPVRHNPQFLLVHHTAMSNDNGGAAVVRQIWQYHALSQKWGDIRYHYLISQDGTIYEGRWPGGSNSNIFVEGGQTMDSNTGKIGVVLLGQFEPNAPNPAPGEPTPAALQSLIRLLGTIAYEQNLDPLGETHHALDDKTYPVIAGHRDHYPGTQCPGENLYSLLDDIRAEVAEEVRRLREQDQTEPTEQVLTIAASSTQVAWGKTVWPNLVWGTPYLYSGAWGEVQYRSLIEIKLSADLTGDQITGLELLLTGKYAHYLRETDGDWEASVLAEPLRGDTGSTVSFEALQTAPAAVVFSPTLSVDDLGPNQENRLSIDPTKLNAVQEAVEQGYLSIRLVGPEQGRRLFAWDSGQNGPGPIVKLTVHRPSHDQATSDLEIKEITVERVEENRVKLAALIANVGQAPTSTPVELAFFVDDRYVFSKTLQPLAAGSSVTVQPQETLSLTGVHKVTAALDDVESAPLVRKNKTIR